MYVRLKSKLAAFFVIMCLSTLVPSPEAQTQSFESAPFSPVDIREIETPIDDAAIFEAPGGDAQVRKFKALKAIYR